jgi:pectinesterase
MIRPKITAAVCIWIIFSFIGAAFGDAGQIKVKVTNPLNENRTSETISVNLKASPALSQFSTGSKPSVYSEHLKQFILCQTIDNDGDGKNDELIFQADFEPEQTQMFGITESNQTQDVNTAYRTNAMFVPQRKDDFAWENDRIAFRMYGQELQRTELTSSGIDVWVKKVKEPVMLDLYAKGHDYFHSDNPQAIDFFNIGPTLGCGGLGVWFDSKLYQSENYEQWKIIANGPIRSIFELTYKPWQFGDKKAGEIKKISLDLGSNFNRIESRFDADVNDVILAVGIVKCERSGKPTYAKDKSWMGYWENPDPNFGIVGCAVILPKNAARNESVDEKNNCLLLAKPNGLRSIVYYAGACWNKTPDFDSEEKWLSFVQKKARLIEKPLNIEVLGDK